MAKINWGAGLKRVFIAFCALWAIGTMLCLWLVPSNYIFEAKEVPDMDWKLWNTTAPDGTPYIVYAEFESEASTWTDEYTRALESPVSGEAWKTGKIVMGDDKPNTGKFDPSTAKLIPTVLSQGEAFDFSADLRDATIQKALTRYFKEARAEQDKTLHAEQWSTRGWIALISGILFGVLCAIIFSIRWIVLGFRSEKA